MKSIINETVENTNTNFTRTDWSNNLIELMRITVESTLNEIMAAQADELVEEGNYRNGYRERSLNTPIGVLHLQIPKLRRGTFFPDNLLTRYSRTEMALIAATREMVINGISTRKVQKVVHKLNVMSMSKSQISRICGKLDETIAHFQTEELDMRYPYIWLDATYLKCRNEGHVSSDAFVTAIAAGEDGYKHLIGVDIVDTESYDSWKGFLLGLRNRGVKDVICVVSDAHEGLKRAIQETFSGATWQRCIVHLMRDVLRASTSKKQKAIFAALTTSIFKETDPELIRKLYHQVCAKIESLNPNAAKILEEAEADALAYLDFPEEHQVRLRTNNVQERLNREIKRRSNVIQVFPSRNSCLRLIGAVLSEIEEGWGAKRWFAKESILEAYERHKPKSLKLSEKELEDRCNAIITMSEKKALDSLGIAA